MTILFLNKLRQKWKQVDRFKDYSVIEHKLRQKYWTLCQKWKHVDRFQDYSGI